MKRRISINDSHTKIDIDGLSVNIDDINGNKFTCHTESGESIIVLQDEKHIAFGRTERAAELQLRKLKFEDSSEEDRIKDFVSNYSPDMQKTVDEWAIIYRDLTGACDRGIIKFIRDKKLKRYDKYTTFGFLDVVDGAYGGDIITKVREAYQTQTQTSINKI